MSDTWQSEIIGDFAAWADALNGIVPSDRIDAARSAIMARLATERNGTRILIRGARYEELEDAETRLADLTDLVSSLVYLCQSDDCPVETIPDLFDAVKVLADFVGLRTARLRVGTVVTSKDWGRGEVLSDNGDGSILVAWAGLDKPTIVSIEAVNVGG